MKMDEPQAHVSMWMNLPMLSSPFLLLLFSPGWLTTATLDWTRLVSSLYLQSSSSVGNCGRGNLIQIWVVLCFLNISPSQMSGQTRGLNVLRTVHSQKAKNIIKSIITTHILITVSKNLLLEFIKYSLIIISQAIGGVNYNVYRLRANKKQLTYIFGMNYSYGYSKHMNT